MAHLCTRNSTVFRGSTKEEGESYLLNLNSNLNPVEKEEKRKINLKERKSRIYIYIYTRNIRSRVFIDAAGTQVRISISKLLNLSRFDSTDYRFVVRTTFPSTTIHWQLARGIYQDFVYGKPIPYTNSYHRTIRFIIDSGGN